MECLVRDTGYRSESAEVDTAGRTFSLTVLLFNDTFRYVSFLRKRDISLLAVTVRERSANPVEFRSQQVRSGGEKKAFWCRAGCPSSSSKSVYSKHPVQPSLCVREMAPGFFISGGFSLGSVQYEYGRNMLKFILVIHGLILIYVYGKVSFMDRGFFNCAVLGNSEKVLP